MGHVREEPVHGFLGLFDILIDFPKPLIVAVNGLGVGIGATICGLADMAFMAESARLRCPFILTAPAKPLHIRYGSGFSGGAVAGLYQFRPGEPG